MNKWFESFLPGRQQCVKLSCDKSSWLDVISSVLAGSLCGPVLYNIYVNDMPDCLQFCKIIIYADDARVFLNGQCDNAYEKMLGDLEIIMQWSLIWQL